MVNKEDTADKVITLLNEFNLTERIEIMANVFIVEGVSQIPDFPTKGGLTTDEVISLIAKDKEKHGETIGNALALQGLMMLQWLNS